MRKPEPGREVVLFVPLPRDLGQAGDGRPRVHRYRSLDLCLGRELHAFRARYGLTQDEVARVVAATSGPTISQWEAGRTCPTVSAASGCVNSSTGGVGRADQPAT